MEKREWAWIVLVLIALLTVLAVSSIFYFGIITWNAAGHVIVIQEEEAQVLEGKRDNATLTIKPKTPHHIIPLTLFSTSP